MQPFTRKTAYTLLLGAAAYTITYFAFDGNGKVDIAGYGKGDYFVKGDSVVVFPDKDIFIFKKS